MRVLVACEFSGIVREAFARRGHRAFSCDIEPTEQPSPHHIQYDVRLIFGWGWDLMIAHPPCTHLASSGARYFKAKVDQQTESIRFVRDLWEAPIPRIALENPIGVLSRHLGKPDQIVQPYQFGDPECKATCLWLKALPKLVPTDLVDGLYQSVADAAPSKHRAKDRSRTFLGLADAMAAQWG